MAAVLPSRAACLRVSRPARAGLKVQAVARPLGLRTATRQPSSTATNVAAVSGVSVSDFPRNAVGTGLMDSAGQRTR